MVATSNSSNSNWVRLYSYMELSSFEQPNDQYRNIAYKYYVIDANADVPDAFFETYNEAATYQKGLSPSITNML